MKYGFIIDNRKCIGCHACTTACKAEHEVPVGVNRTWVKQVEKGAFPHTKRLFSVMRCNHCSDAPCVEICPTEALFFRNDGIVDFDKERCIGCKSCMQACPYDALYIDPETHTAAKCNYCAHRIDIGLEPACVNVCPEHAIISGDMEDPDAEISRMLSRNPVKVRKPEKATRPNLFYIDADDVSLIPTATERTADSLWGQQVRGVGHFAKETEKLAFSNEDVVTELVRLNGGFHHEGKKVQSPKTVEIIMDSAKQVYNTPDKGILWGWEVPAYVWTKAISAGTFLVPFTGWLTGILDFTGQVLYYSTAMSLIFLILTGLLLVKDLDQPTRFVYVLLRPHWSSWLVRGGYGITVYGGLLTVLTMIEFFNWNIVKSPFIWVTAASAMFVALYTAFLFAQAKGRDFWQSPALAVHMGVHSFMAGAGVFILLGFFQIIFESLTGFLTQVLFTGILINITTIIIEMCMTHPTSDAKKTVNMILRGKYKMTFYTGIIFTGNILPALLLMSGQPVLVAFSAASVLYGIYLTEKVWVEAPQRIPLV